MKSGKLNDMEKVTIKSGYFIFALLKISMNLLLYVTELRQTLYYETRCQSNLYTSQFVQ